MLGDFPRALGNLHVVESALPSEAYRPEAAVLRSIGYLAHCQYEDTTTLAARFHERYQPIANELATLLRSHREEDQEAAFYRLLLDLRDGKTNLSSRTKVAALDALGDRQLRRHIQYIEYLDGERRRLDRSSATFRKSLLGGAVEDALTLARDIAVRITGQLVQERLQRSLDELQVHLVDNAKILAAAMAGRRGAPVPGLEPWRVPARDAGRDVARPGETDDVVHWPFTGELWGDEGGYRQSIRSLCK